jgi:hypothetical protein
MKIYDDIITATLMAIVVLVPLYFDTKLFSCFDLSKITALYILTGVLIIVWALKKITPYFCR